MKTIRLAEHTGFFKTCAGPDYVGWIVLRMAECEGEDRCSGAVESVVGLAEGFLDGC